MIESSLTTMLRLTFVYAVLNSSTLCCAEPEPLTPEVLAVYGPGLKIRVVDQQGHPVEGAHAGFNVIRTPDGWRFGCNEDCQPTDAKGEVSLVKGSRFVGRAAMVAIHEGRGLAGLRLPSKEGEGDEPYEIVIIPSRRVIGRVQMAQLDQRGQFPGWLGGTVQVGEFDPFQWISPTGDIELLLPPGDYELRASGTYGHQARQSLSVKAG